jgi:spore germination protein KA
MSFKNLWNSLTSYTPPNEYQFSLLEKSNRPPSPYSGNGQENNSPKAKTAIYPSLSVSLEYVNTHYNVMINSDIIVREFTLNARSKQYHAFLLYIDGMIDSELMDHFVLQPLMMRNQNNLFEGEQNRVISEAVTNNITVRKVKKFDLGAYLMNCLLPQNTVNQVSNFEEAFSGVNSGNCALFVDTLPIVFDIEVKGFKQRSVDRPSNEIVIKGPHEAFVESIRTNTSLIRRVINNENLIIENVEIGKITKTKCALCYMKNITNTDLIAEARYRLNNLEIDSMLSAGQLEQLIADSNDLGVPQALSTERPDKAVGYLLDGRVVLMVNGTPYAIVVPAIFNDFLSSPDDRNLKVTFSNFLKGIRFLAVFLTLLLPGFYIAVTSFHQEVLPTELLFSILASRESVPFPIIFELLVMEISFELIREAGLRVPSPIGPTIGIVGALVLGQAAVSAGIVSPILIIIVAITGIASFAIPDYSFGFHLRYFRFLFIFLGYMSGFFGIALGFFVYLAVLCNTDSFGIPYMVNTSSLENSKHHSYFLPPIWKREYRASFLNPQKAKRQEPIAMKWKYK